MTEEFNKKLTEAIEAGREKELSYTIRNGVSRTLSPSIEITLHGGDFEAVRTLGVQIEELILGFVKGQE